VNKSSSQFAPDDTRLQDDLIRGISLMVTGLIVGLGHRFGQFATETPEERRRSGLARAENLVGTLAFGLVSIIALPVASYSILHRVILGGQSVNSGQTDTPGAALALALVFLPAWLYYLYRFVMGARRRDSAPEVAV
jgi:fructose-specific phosphotransferase system IIC component